MLNDLVMIQRIQLQRKGGWEMDRTSKNKMVKYEGQSISVGDNVKDWKVNVKQMRMFKGGDGCHDLSHDDCQSLSLIFFYYPPNDR